MFEPERLERALARFSELATFQPYGYAWSATFDGGQHDRNVVFGVMTHGDEVGPLEGAIAVMEALASGALSYGGRVTFMVGNPEAGRRDRRFLHADLNRVFVFDAPQGAVPPDEGHEHRRARELKPILDEAHFFLDFHQTILRTSRSFYIFPWDEKVYTWARALQVTDALVTRAPGQAFSGSQRCADEYVNLLGGTAFTVELSQKGFQPEAIAAAERGMRNALALNDALAAGTTRVEDAAAAAPELDFFMRVHSERWADPAANLRSGLVNFQPVTAGEELGDGHGPSLRAPRDGLLLFPKYVQRGADGWPLGPLPGEIYTLLAPLDAHPRSLWGPA